MLCQEHCTLLARMLVLSALAVHKQLEINTLHTKL